MILVRFTGGIGNQMFQYAFAKSLSFKYNVPLKFDTSLLGENKDVEHLVVRHFDLDVFNLPEKYGDSSDIVKFNGYPKPNLFQKIVYKIYRITKRYPLVIQRGNEYNSDQINAIGKSACIIGRWQSEEFFKAHSDKIKNLFSFTNFQPNDYSVSIAKQIEVDQISISIQVRRGDYITNPRYAQGIGALTLKYYEDAIELMKTKLSALNKEMKFYFVSNDIHWCKEHFSHLPNSFFVEQENSKNGYVSDLWLLSQFRYSIISNSTFSWWGAWLGEKRDGIVIAPKNWTRDVNESSADCVPERWMKIDNQFEPLN